MRLESLCLRGENYKTSIPREFRDKKLFKKFPSLKFEEKIEITDRAIFKKEFYRFLSKKNENDLSTFAGFTDFGDKYFKESMDIQRCLKTLVFPTTTLLPDTLRTSCVPLSFAHHARCARGKTKVPVFFQHSASSYSEEYYFVEIHKNPFQR